MEGSGGDFKFPTHRLHHLPRIPPWVSGGSRHGYRHPRGKTASAVRGLEGGGPVHDLSGTAQGVWRLGQVHMPQYPGGLWYVTPRMTAPMEILESAEDGGEVGRVSRGGVHRCPGHDAGRPAIPHHLQRGGGCGNATLGVSYGGGSRRAVRVRTRGKK